MCPQGQRRFEYVAHRGDALKNRDGPYFFDSLIIRTRSLFISPLTFGDVLKPAFLSGSGFLVVQGAKGTLLIS